MFRFHPLYFIFTIFLFGVELFIGFQMHDSFVRPYVGDFLVVILLYCFIKSFFNTPVVFTAILVLLFACAIEAAQYFHLVDKLGFQNNRVLHILLGSSFEWTDIAAYTFGILAVLGVETLVRKKRR